MAFNKTRRILKLRLTKQQIAACRFLEARGQVFCADFGYKNAVAKMNALDPNATAGIAELERMMEL